jgi:hypothetical protein
MSSKRNVDMLPSQYQGSKIQRNPLDLIFENRQNIYQAAAVWPLQKKCAAYQWGIMQKN